MSCCPSIWWCTAGGPEEVSPDGDGLYTRPEGATGHPFKSLAEASAVCPQGSTSGDCSGCATSYTFPASYVIMTFSNVTGGTLPNSIIIQKNASTGFLAYYYNFPPFEDDGFEYYPSVTIACLSGGGLRIGLSFALKGTPGVGGTAAVATAVSSATGWLFSGTGAYTDVACGDQPDLDVLIGTVTFSGVNFSGTADVYLST